MRHAIPHHDERRLTSGKSASAQAVGESATRVLAVIEATNQLRESAAVEFQTLMAEKPELLETVIGKQVVKIEAEIALMKEEQVKLEREIGELFSS